MARIRLSEESLKVIQDYAQPGETPGAVLERLLKSVRYNENTKLEGAGLTYQELAKRWKRSVSFVKGKAQLYRDTNGEQGLGPVNRLGFRSVIVPWSVILEYEKRGVW